MLILHHVLYNIVKELAVLSSGSHNMDRFNEIRLSMFVGGPHKFPKLKEKLLRSST